MRSHCRRPCLYAASVMVVVQRRALDLNACALTPVTSIAILMLKVFGLLAAFIHHGSVEQFRDGADMRDMLG